MKTILVASDLSERSDRAMRRAASLAKAHGAKLIAMAVIDEDLPSAIAATQVEQAGAQLSSAFGENADGAEFKAVIGDPFRDIHTAAAEANADLIVLGLHRPRPMLDLFRETTMERLVRMSERPVLIVRDLGVGDYARILTPIDFSPASEAALRAASTISPGADVQAFHAYHVPFQGFRGGQVSAAESNSFRRQANAEMEKWLKTADLPASAPKIELVEGSIQQVLMQRIGTFKPDLIAIGAHGRSSVAPGIVGNVTLELKRNPPCDMLIARQKIM